MNQQTQSVPAPEKSIKFKIKPAEITPWNPATKNFGQLLDKFNGRPATVLLVGACDLKSFDNDLYPHLVQNKHWKGIFVEPVPALFESLVQNIEFLPNKLALNYAITESTQEYPIYIPSGKPKWLLGCPSLKMNPILEKFECEKKMIQGTNFDTLLTIIPDKFKRTIDILQIDTEGYDLIIIQQIIPRYLPKIIRVEQKHLIGADKTKLKKFLTLHNYDFKRVGLDYICQHK